MCRLVWSILLGVCGISCAIMYGAQPDINPVPKALERARSSLPMGTGVQAQTMLPASVATSKKEQVAMPGAPALPPTKELAFEPQKSFVNTVTGRTQIAMPVVSPAITPTAPSVPSTPTQAAAVPEEIKSIDTMDLEQPEGNWLTKRIWWEHAKDKYKECREVFEKIFASRMTFLEHRAEIEKTTFGPFYREIGLEQAEVQEVLTSLIDYIEQEREETGYLDEKVRAYRDKISAAKKDLEQLKLDIDTINNIDIAIDKAINTLSSKINEAHRFEQSAWDEFEAIAHELSDKRAYERYYVIDGIHKNLKELQKYIEGEFTTYFNQLIQQATDKTERAKKEIKTLKEQDIDLQEQASLLVSEEQAKEDEQSRREAQKAAEEAKKAAEAAKVTFLCKIWNSLIGGLKNLWNLIFGWWLFKL